MDLAEFAARLESVASELEDGAARDAAERAGDEFHARLQENTPVLTGALRDSEALDGVTGSGSTAVARISTHLPLYASFREYGGTITVKRASVLTNGESFFGKSVTQHGSEYMGRTVAWAEGGGIDNVVSAVIMTILRQI
jgi:hypothetical protein